MPGIGGGIFHVTHRCHDRAFLLKFGRDRTAYCTKLRELTRPFAVSVLDYCVTSNHVHLLLDVAERWQLGGFMRQVAGEFARAYNRRKARTNAFWGDNYHATMVEDGKYLWDCLCYIELNMVRCGVVKHPRQWRWVGYHEIMGHRQRYRLIDVPRLCWRLQTDRLEDLRLHLEASLQERTARGLVQREPRWTESLAVGSRQFVQQMEPLMKSRQEMDLIQESADTWMLRDAAAP